MVVYLVECAHHVAREIVYPFHDQEVHLLGFPGCYPNAYAHRMLRQLCTHPNVGAALLVSLGCEGFNRSELLREIRATGRPADVLVIQESGRHAANDRRGTGVDQRRARANRANAARGVWGRRSRRGHGLRRLRCDERDHRQSGGRAAPSIGWSKTGRG